MTLATGCVLAQSTTVQTPFQKQMERVDLGVSAVGLLNKTVSGPVLPPGTSQGTLLTEQPSNTVGALVKIRYVAKPYLGFEVNYVYSRYAENFTPPPGTNGTFNPQSNASEYSFGYVATPPHKIFDWQPYVGGGIGTLAFKPTPHGGEELPEKARMLYYYDVGVQREYFSHFGARITFRQLFYLAPDFGQNYLTILKHSNSIEPGIGFFLRF